MPVVVFRKKNQGFPDCRFQFLNYSTNPNSLELQSIPDRFRFMNELNPSVIKKNPPPHDISSPKHQNIVPGMKNDQIVMSWNLSIECPNIAARWVPSGHLLVIRQSASVKVFPASILNGVLGMITSPSYCPTGAFAVSDRQGAVKNLAVRQVWRVPVCRWEPARVYPYGLDCWDGCGGDRFERHGKVLVVLLVRKKLQKRSNGILHERQKKECKKIWELVKKCLERCQEIESHNIRIHWMLFNETNDGRSCFDISFSLKNGSCQEAKKNRQKSTVNGKENLRE